MAGMSRTPDAAYTHDSHTEAMHEESDAGTEEFDTAPLTHGMHAEWRELVEYSKPSLPVLFRPDGPQLAFVFDDPPSPDGADGTDADAPIKRKRVMVDGYEMEEDGEDGMNVSTQLCHLAASQFALCHYMYCRQCLLHLACHYLQQTSLTCLMCKARLVTQWFCICIELLLPLLHNVGYSLKLQLFAAKQPHMSAVQESTVEC